MGFMTPISKRAEEEFEKIRASHPDKYKDQDIKEYRKCSDDGKEIWYYDAKIIFEYLIKEFNKKDTTFNKWKLFIFVTLSFMYGICPGIFRSIYGQTFHGEDWVAILGFYLNSLSSAFLMMTIIMFYTSAKIDMRRRSFILRQLGQMISP